LPVMKAVCFRIFPILMVLACSSASAARVENLYAVEVGLPAGATTALEKAFDVALRQVLVKVTGRRSVGDDQTVVRAFGDTAALVQQYRIDSAGTVWVLFDRIAVKRMLDQLGQPVWGEERPATLVWLVMDAGTGKREFLAAGSNLIDTTGRVDTGADDRIAANEASVREILEASAHARGMPLMLPLVDSSELSSISVSDVWGGFTETLLDASTRYGADAVLVGRARVFSGERMDVRWTLLVEDQRYDWEGDVASGPDKLADFFAARLARAAGPQGQILLQVNGVDSLDAYGRLSAYLAALEVVDDFAVNRIAESEVLFSLSIRGDVDLLMRIIALQRVLQLVEEPVGKGPGSFPGSGGDTPDLHYQLIAGP
jgi:hypothetical protein